MSKHAVIKALAEQLGYDRLAELEIEAVRGRPVPRRLIEHLSVMGDTGIDLTPRQREVMVLLCSGFTQKEIADALGITTDTVHSHLQHVYQRLGVHNRVEAVNAFLERAA